MGRLKFDNIIGNPPYRQMIDMKFVRRSYEICSNHLMYVHPTTWLLDEKRRQSAFNKTRELVKNNMREIHLFNGNTVFGIGLFVPCGITWIDKNYDTESNGINCQDDTRGVSLRYNDIWEINKFSDLKVYSSLKKKILDWCKANQSLQDVLDAGSKGEYWVNVAQIRGGVFTSSSSESYKMRLDDFYTFVPRDLKVQSKPAKTNKFGFFSKEESENFLAYLKTDFARFCLAIYKNNQNLSRGELRAVPYVGYHKKWTDKELFKMFDLTSEEIEFIKKEIPKYY